MPLQLDTQAAPLIERDAPLAQWAQVLRHIVVPGAAGACLLLHGEAGIGKTSLLRAARARSPAHCDWLTGLCEPLLSPTPLGPLLDILDGLPPSLAAALGAQRHLHALLPDLLAWLRRLSRPLVMVVDDAQWADSASLDVLRFIGRRIEGLRVLLVLSYRDDGLHADHPLHSVIGALPTARTTRIALAALSPQAVLGMAQGVGRQARGLHSLTQGNPLYLVEVLAAPAGGLPASVRDAVLARAQGLSGSARALLEL